MRNQIFKIIGWSLVLIIAIAFLVFAVKTPTNESHHEDEIEFCDHQGKDCGPKNSHQVDTSSSNNRLESENLKLSRPHKPLNRSTKQLRQVLLLHRHGDRTPIDLNDGDPLKNKDLWWFYGRGQLTNVGKKRLFRLGQIYRERYNDLFSGSVNKNYVVSRASGSFRCIESSEVFLASFLALNVMNSSDSKDLIWDSPNTNPLAGLWQPARVQSVPVEIDGMLAESAVCKNLDDEYNDVINNRPEVKQINLDYQHEAKVLKELMGYKMTHFYEWFWASSTMLVERTNFPTEFNPELEKIYLRVVEAGNKAFTAYQSTLNSRTYRVGLLLQDMIQHMKETRAITEGLESQNPYEVKKFIHYSSHDVNIVAFLGVLDAWKDFTNRPGYASNIVIELYQDVQDWYVRIFYMPEVSLTGDSKIHEIHLRQCSDNQSRCSLDKFEELMKQYIISSWMSWMERCGNSLNDINPYTRGR